MHTALLLLFYLHYISVNCNEIKMEYFLQEVVLQTYRCPDGKMLLKQNLRKIRCATVCLENESCLSIFYKPETTECVTCASNNGVDDGVISGTTLFYKKEIPPIRADSLGCFIDCPRLWDGVFIENDVMTVDYCVEHCNTQSHKYALLEYGKQCFCGSDGSFLSANIRVVESECEMACIANSAQMCGDDCRGNVYEIGSGGGT